MMGPHYKKLMGMHIVEPSLKYFLGIFTLRNPCLKCIVRPTCSKVGEDVCESKDDYYETWAYIEHYKRRAINNLKVAWNLTKYISAKAMYGLAITGFVLGYGYLIFMVIRINVMVWGWNP